MVLWKSEQVMLKRSGQRGTDRQYGACFLLSSLNVKIWTELRRTVVETATRLVDGRIGKLSAVVMVDVAVSSRHSLKTVVGLFGAHSNVNHELDLHALIRSGRFVVKRSTAIPHILDDFP